MYTWLKGSCSHDYQRVANPTNRSRLEASRTGSGHFRLHGIGQIGGTDVAVQLESIQLRIHYILTLRNVCLRDLEHLFQLFSARISLEDSVSNTGASVKTEI